MQGTGLGICEDRHGMHGSAAGGMHVTTSATAGLIPMPCTMQHAMPHPWAQVKGSYPTNEEMTTFCETKVRRGEWGQVIKHKRAVFARQMKVAGKVMVTRSVHAHIEGSTRAFTYGVPADSSISMKRLYLVPGDYLSIVVGKTGKKKVAGLVLSDVAQ